MIVIDVFYLACLVACYCYYYYYYYYYFKPRVAPRAREKNAFHVKGVGEIVNQTVKSDRAITPLLKT